MLNHEHFDEQARKLALDIRRITGCHSERLKHLYNNPAVQIYELAHTKTEPVLYINNQAPDDIAAEIQAAYQQRFL